jgi:hypothetical protein
MVEKETQKMQMIVPESNTACRPSITPRKLLWPIRIGARANWRIQSLVTGRSRCSYCIDSLQMLPGIEPGPIFVSKTRLLVYNRKAIYPEDV